MGNLKERESRRRASVVGSIIEQQPAEETANIITFLSQKNEINKKDKYYKPFSIFTTDNQLIKSNHYNKINSIINGFYIYIA